MKFKMSPIKVCAALIIGVAVFAFTLSAIDSGVNRLETQSLSSESFVIYSSAAPGATFELSEMNQPSSELMARLFQLMFILFFISPPIIALMLFLIWKELRKRNELK